MEVVTLDGQAADNGLALMLQGLIAESVVGSDAKRRDFEAMRSSFGIVAPDAEVTVTLEFGGGRCTIYDGLRHEPDLVITADSGKIPELSLIPFRYGVPWLLEEQGQKQVKELLLAFLKREIKIHGFVKIPPTPFRTARAAVDLFRLTRILSVT
jgi:hypothetical protein